MSKTRKNCALMALLSAGALCTGVTPASAGYWEEVQNPYAWDQYSPESQSYNAERLDGTVSLYANNYQSGPNGPVQNWSESRTWQAHGEVLAGFATAILPEGYGGSFGASSNGKRRSLFKWVRDWTFDDEWNLIEDPNDNPPPVLNLKIDAWGGASACSDVNNIDRDPSKEHITASVRIPKGDNDEDTQATEGTVEIDQTVAGGAIFKTKGARSKKLVPVPTNGQDEVWGPWVDFDVSVDVDGDRFVGEEESATALRGEANVDLGYSISFDNRTVHITSSFETFGTYEKSTTDPTTGLPAPSPLPNEPATFFGKLNVRNADGSMKVDTAADWRVVSSAMGSVNRSWFGGGQYQAQAANFTSPTYEWEIDPNAFNNSILGIYPIYSNGGQAIDFGPETIGGNNVQETFGHILSGTYKDGPSTKETTLTVNVTDSDNTVGSNTYTVKWHAPFENWVKYGQKDGPDENFPPAQPGSLTAPAGQEVQYLRAPEKNHIDLKSSLNLISLALGATENIATLYAGSSVVSSHPYGFAALGLIATATSIADWSIGPEPDPSPLDEDVNYARYQEAVAEQIASGNYPLPDGRPRITPPAGHTLQQMQAEIDLGVGEENDRYYNGYFGSLQADARVYRKTFEHLWQGDKYAATGYEDQQLCSVFKTGTTYCDLSWYY